MKKLPIGIQTFHRLIREGYCYVDKTPLIHEMVESGRYYFLSRPRRFGKSLLVSTLKSAFQGEKALFDGLYLEHQWDWDRRHPVVHISLGGGVVEDREMLDAKLNEFIETHLEQHEIELNSASLSGRFSELIRRLHDKYQQPVVVLVDEYDKPILDGIVADQPARALAMREGLKSFYSVIKESDEYLQFVLLTGVSKFSKVSLFSGLNNLEDITLNARYATLCGYTEAELSTVFADYLVDVDLEALRDWYNGYNFLGDKVYNPYDVLLYLKNRVFRAYWFETASPSFLIKRLQQEHYPAPDLERFESSGELLGSFDIDQIAPETLLFQTGYLTIDHVERLGDEEFYTLRYPNREVKTSLNSHFLNALVNAPTAKSGNQKAVYRALQAGRIDDLRDLFHAFFASIPNDWYRKNRLAEYEGYYASVVYCYFAALGLDITAEDVTNRGRIDLTVRLGGRVFVIEFKVAEWDEEGGAPLAQIKRKRYFEKYLGQGEVYLIGVSFSKETRNIEPFEWERAG